MNQRIGDHTRDGSAVIETRRRVDGEGKQSSALTDGNGEAGSARCRYLSEDVLKSPILHFFLAFMSGGRQRCRQNRERRSDCHVVARKINRDRVLRIEVEAE